MIRAIKNILIIIIIAIFLICAASFLSYIKFETANALSSGVGLAKYYSLTSITLRYRNRRVSFWHSLKTHLSYCSV